MSPPSPAAVRLLVVAGLLAAGAGCSTVDKAPPIASASFSASRNRVALGSPVDLTYKFEVAPNFAVQGDYHVFVHIVDADGKQLWGDDHEPPVPTSQWKPGQTIGPYTRTKFVPVVSYLGEVFVRLGLYKDRDRLPLAAVDPADRQSSSREYKVGTLQLLPRSENVVVIYKGGWYPPEYTTETPPNSWQWTQKVANVSVANPKKDVTLYLDYDARPDLFGNHPQTVTVSAGDLVVATFPADNAKQTLRRVPLTAAQLGSGEIVDLRLEVDRTFAPATLPNGDDKDPRALGIRVFHLFVEPQ